MLFILLVRKTNNNDDGAECSFICLFGLFFKGISTSYGLFSAEIELISKCNHNYSFITLSKFS